MFPHLNKRNTIYPRKPKGTLVLSHAYNNDTKHTQEFENALLLRFPNRGDYSRKSDDIFLS